MFLLHKPWTQATHLNDKNSHPNPRSSTYLDLPSHHHQTNKHHQQKLLKSTYVPKNAYYLSSHCHCHCHHRGPGPGPGPAGPLRRLPPPPHPSHACPPAAPVSQRSPTAVSVVGPPGRHGAVRRVRAGAQGRRDAARRRGDEETARRGGPGGRRRARARARAVEESERAPPCGHLVLRQCCPISRRSDSLVLGT